MVLQEHKFDKDGVQFTFFDELFSGTGTAVAGSWKSERNPVLKDPKFMIDLGANVGIWTFFMAKKYPDCKIVAVEPMPNAYTSLIKGIEKNEFKNVGIIGTAITSHEGSLTLRSHRSNSGATSAFLPKDELFREEKVPAITLNQLFETLHFNVDLIKVDIEGCEYSVFEDFKYWDRIGAMTIELHPWPQFQGVELQREKTEGLITLLHKHMKDKPLYIEEFEFREDDFLECVRPDLLEFDKKYEEMYPQVLEANGIQT